MRFPDLRGLLRDSAFLLAASLVASVLNALVHPIMGRSLGEVDYAVFGSLLSLWNVLNIPSSAAMTTMARFVAEYSRGNDTAMWVTLVRRAVRRVTMVGVVALVAWSLMPAALVHALRVPSRATLILVGIAAFLSLYAPVIQGTLQGARRFGWMAWSAIGGAGTRLAVSALAAAMAWGVFGAFGGVAAGAAAGLALGLAPFYRVLRATPSLERFDTKPAYRYLFPVVVGQGALAVLMNLDIVLAPQFLDGDQLGAYSKAAILSRMAMILPQPLVSDAFPRMVVSAHRGLLIGPLAMALAVAGACAAGLSLLPGIPLGVVYGADTPIHTGVLRVYAWIMVPMTLAGAAAQYLWARHEVGRALRLVPVVALYAGALFLWHGTAMQITAVVLTGALVSGAVLLHAVATMPRDEQATPG